MNQQVAIGEDEVAPLFREVNSLEGDRSDPGAMDLLTGV